MNQQLETMNKEYIGDSVYVELNDCNQFVLTTENGYGPSNTIVFELEVFEALKQYVNRFIAMHDDERLRVWTENKPTT